ncbi:MAG: site-specific DNA-methyltransferase [Curvibacter sp.]|jgi:adenine-specific DNA-methyltransferase
MPEIVFKGKEYVYNHHLTVPYRPLVVDKAKGIGPGDLAGNLVIHGDNLHALKALLPRYAGQVDLVFIDPPYNTGNEGWCYNDNVNSPIMKEWLSSNPVDGEDLLRHDKWLCMMWPRLVLLRELLSERGSIWITLDDNEVHRAREMLDEIFGGNSHVGTLIWQKKYSTKSDTRFFSESHDYVLVYAKNIEQVHIGGLKRTESQDAAYKNPDNDVRGPWASDNLLRSEARGYAIYAVRGPTGQDYYPPPGTSWRYNEDKMRELISDKRVWFGADGTARPRLKRFLSEVQQAVPAQTIWGYGDVNHSDGAKKNLTEMFGGKEPPFATPKPVELLDRVISIGTEWDSIVLDSFAGSGTTAHAVLKANSKDNGQRKFILVEGEDYADRLTAERVRRAIKGYAWVGTQRETLLEEKITYTQFKKAPEWLAKVEAIKAREGFAEGDLVDQGTTKKKRFDKINVELKDGVLRVEGEKRVSQMADGLGGEFAYCTLGEPLDVEKLLSGASLPAYDALGAWLFHTATGGTLLPAPKAAPRWYLGEAKDAHVWLVYEPHLNFLKSPEAALTLSRAKEFAAWGHARNNGQGDGKRHLVFAPAKYLSNKQLLEHGVDFAPLPFALYREG